VPLYRRLGFRQTIIPPMLTLGVLLPIFGILPLISSEESPWSAISRWIAFTAIGLGVVLLAMAILNMFLVKQQLADEAQAR
jgi:protein-S-isoprenylcysteine O-methyltransferase Ste14